MTLTHKRVIYLFTFNILIWCGLIYLIGSDNLELAYDATKKNWIYPLGFILLLFIIFFLRALRWKIIIPAHTHIIVLWRSLLTAWFLNALMPARLGDVSRVVILTMKEDVDVGTSVVSLVTDRLLDLVSLLLLLIICIGLQPNIVSAEIGLIYIIVTTMLIIIIIIVMGLILYVPDTLKRTFSFLLRPFSRLITLSHNTIDQIHCSIKNLTKLNKGSVILAIVLSFSIWILESSSIFIFAKTLDHDIPLTVSIVAAIFGFLAMTLPISPGGFGTYEAAIVGVLIVLTDLSFDDALLIAVIDHLFRQFFFMVIGSIALQSFNIPISSILSYKIKDNSNDENEAI